MKKTIGILILGFFALFIFKSICGHNETDEPIPIFNEIHTLESVLEIRKNYATKKHRVIVGQSPVRIDQKYEKIADIKTVSSRFDTDEHSIRKRIEDHNGLIQFENKNGNEGYRNLNLIIGVPPENFDSIYNQLIKIGNVQAKQITKKDKTNEYKELNAKKSSLEKIRASLIDLKSEGGSIEEYIQLENRILEIEQQLQELGVSLGNFDEENEFCTVKFLLSETRGKDTSFLHRLKVTLEWTILVYLKLMAVLTLMVAFAYLTALTIERIHQKNQ